MLRKPIIWLFLIAGLFAILIFYFAYTGEEFRSSDPFEAVPHDAVLILRTGTLMKQIEERNRNPIWNELLNFPAVKRTDRQIGFLDSLTKTDPGIRDLLEHGEAVFSLHLAGKLRYDYIFYKPLEDRKHEKKIIGFIESRMAPGGQLSERKYEQDKIYEADFMSASRRDFSFCVTRGLFMLSHSSILIEEAVRQISLGNPLSGQPDFSRVHATAGKKVEANLYLNLRNFPALLASLLNEKLRPMLTRTRDLGDWAALDINLKNRAILLNGFSSAGQGDNQLLDLLITQSPQRNEIKSIIPSDCAAFLSFGYGDYPAFKKRYEEYLDIKGILRSHLREMEELNAKYDYDFGRSFQQLIEKELALIFLGLPGLTAEENVFYAVRCKSQTQAAEQVEEMLRLISDAEAIHLSKLVFEVSVANDFNQRFYNLPVRSLASYLFGNFMSGIENPYCTFIGNYLVFGKSVNALSKYLHLNILQATLEKDLDFNSLSDYTASRSNLNFFLNIPRSPEMIDKYLGDEAREALDRNRQSLGKFHAVSCQLSGEDQLLYTSLFLKYSPETREEPQTVWGSRLDNRIIMKPKFVTNHYTYEKEIFLQDNDNKVYLMNNSGRILWKLPLPGQINSDIYQVDYYKNGKLQYLFSTRDQIHLIDRNGNTVENYPLQLRAPTQTGVSLFDYEQNRDYRIFVPGTDRKIYVYDVQGRLVKGWEFEITNDQVYHPVQHFRIGARDYIVCADRYNVYILDRRGRTRIKVREHFPVSQMNPCLLDRGSLNTKHRFVMTDTSGHVRFIHTDGSVEEVVLGDFTPAHFFDHQDLDGDQQKEYIFLDQGVLEVFSADRRKVFSYEFGSPLRQRPVTYAFSANDRKIGIVCDKDNKIYLINNDGSVYRGFPLSGSTYFSIGFFNASSENFHLLVGGSDNFLYNYELQ